MCLIVGHDLTRSPAGTDKFPADYAHRFEWAGNLKQ